MIMMRPEVGGGPSTMAIGEEGGGLPAPPPGMAVGLIAPPPQVVWNRPPAPAPGNLGFAPPPQVYHPPNQGRPIQQPPPIYRPPLGRPIGRPQPRPQPPQLPPHMPVGRPIQPPPPQLPGRPPVGRPIQPRPPQVRPPVQPPLGRPVQPQPGRPSTMAIGEEGGQVGFGQGQWLPFFNPGNRPRG